MVVKSFFTCRKCSIEFQFSGDGNDIPSVCNDCVSSKSFYKDEFIPIICKVCQCALTVIEGSEASIYKICLECEEKSKTHILGVDKVCNSCKDQCTVTLKDSLDKDPYFCPTCREKQIDSDRINPDYYKQGGMEPYEYLKMKLTPDQYEGWLLGDLIVYLSSYNFKHDSLGQIEDIKKASWYLEKLIEFREKGLFPHE